MCRLGLNIMATSNTIQHTMSMVQLYTVSVFCQFTGNQGGAGLAAMPGKESDFKASLATAVEYAKVLSCPR